MGHMQAIPDSLPALSHSGHNRQEHLLQIGKGLAAFLPLPDRHSQLRLMTPTQMRPHEPMLAEWPTILPLIDGPAHRVLGFSPK